MLDPRPPSARQLSNDFTRAVPQLGARLLTTGEEVRPVGRKANAENPSFVRDLPEALATARRVKADHRAVSDAGDAERAAPRDFGGRHVVTECQCVARCELGLAAR